MTDGMHEPVGLSAEELLEWAEMLPHHPGAFYRFTCAAWAHMGDPSPLTPAKYLEVMCGALQSVAMRQSPDLLTNIPPSHTKSVVHCVMYNAWVWTWDPSRRFIYVSYDETPVLRDAEKCRRLVESDWYQARWALAFERGSNAKGYYINTHGGSRLSRTMRSGITSNHADDIIVDDPQNPTRLSLEDAADAAAEAETARHVWDNVLPSRVANIATSRRIVVMQRLSELDLSQHILDQGHPIRHLCLPLYYDPEHPHVCADDWRKAPGELLAPERYTADDIESRVLVKLTPAARAAQYDQDPTATGAGLFGDLSDFRWWAAWDDLPDQGILGVSIDGATAGRARGKAAKAASERSRWAFTAWLRCGGTSYLLDAMAFRDDLDVVLERFGTWVADLIERTKRAPAGRKRRWSPGTIVVERKSCGEAFTSFLRHMDLRGFTWDLYNPEASKAERAAATLPSIRSGKVVLPAEVRSADVGAWRILRGELEKFPRGRTDDLVDTMSQMLLYWQEQLGEGGTTPTSDDMAAFARGLRKR